MQCNYAIHSAFIECMFTQSRTSTYIHILPTLQQSKRTITYIHTEQSTGNNEPESQTLSLQVWEITQWARGSSASGKEGSLDPGGQQGRRSPQSSRAKPLATDAKGDQHGMGQHPGVWSSAVSAVVWSLPQLYLGSCVLHPSGSLYNFLAPLMGSVEFAQELLYGWSHSVDTAVLVTCAGILGVFPCQMCLV